MLFYVLFSLWFSDCMLFSKEYIQSVPFWMDFQVILSSLCSIKSIHCHFDESMLDHSILVKSFHFRSNIPGQKIKQKRTIMA